MFELQLNSRTKRLASPFAQGSQFGRDLTRLVWSSIKFRWHFVNEAARVARERRALREVTDEQLKDMGVSRADADKEANREYFDIPPERLLLRGILE